MIVLSHRGYWGESRAKNSMEAFHRSFGMGFGTETDFRDLGRKLVISHDPPRADALPAEEFFSALAASDPALPIAINIKSDGLQSLLIEALGRHDIRNYFLFDMSVPDAVISIKKNLRVFTRHSDVERHPDFYDAAAGVWMDAFSDDSWLTADEIGKHLDAGKQVCLVSPELHGRPHIPFWQRLRESGIYESPGLMICSDIPEEAKGYFQI